MSPSRSTDVDVACMHNYSFWQDVGRAVSMMLVIHTVQITFIFIDFRVCDFAFAFKTQNAPCVSRFKRILFSDRFQFAF